MENHIRTAADADYAQVEALWLELNEHHVELSPEFIRPVSEYVSKQAYAQIIADPQQDILLLCRDDTVVGAVWLVQRAHEGGQAVPMPVGFIHEICVRRDLRREGYGQLLMIAAEEWARKRRLAHLEFNVWAANSSAIAFYTAQGYTFTRHEMSKRLD